MKEAALWPLKISQLDSPGQLRDREPSSQKQGLAAGAMIRLLYLSVTATLIPGTAALSQDKSEPDADVDAIVEIVVTARKIEEYLQQVPLSVQVLSADFLDDAKQAQLYDLQFSVPGFLASSAGMFGAGFALRGVGNQGGTSLSVASHLDGVYLGVSNLAITRMFDLERVEVVKGPQGTLYGRNATGGSINFITRSPEGELSANVEASYGSFDTARLQGYVNVPFDRVDVRLAFVGSEGDGYIRNSVDDRRFAAADFWGLRGALRARLTENLRLDLMAQRVTDDGASGELWTPQPAYLPDPRDIRLTTVTLENPFLTTENDNVSVNLKYDLGFASFHSVTGYARSVVHSLDDCAGEPSLQGCVRGVDPTKYGQWSQEFRVGATTSSVDWLIGAYFFDADKFENFYQALPPPGSQPINDTTSTSDEIVYAAFGQATLHLGDQWSITGGLRRSVEEYRVTDVGSGSADHPTITTAERESDRTSWRLDLAYAASDSIFSYAGVSTGFKSGGITTTVLPSGNFNGFEAEDLIAYEVGFKAHWLNRGLTANLAAFFYDFSDLQITTIYRFNNRFIAEVENAGKAEIYGVDATGSCRIFDRLTVTGGVVWMPKREFVEFDSATTGDAYSGNKLSRAPEWTATAAVDYEYPWQGRGSVAWRVEYSYRSDFFFTAGNEPRFAQSGFGLLNVLVKFEPTTGKWYVFASGRNLADQDYFNSIFLQSSPGYPDTYEMGVGYRF